MTYPLPNPEDENPDAQKLLARAISLAAQAHYGVYNWEGTPYILHPLRLMLLCTDPVDQILAVLHDVPEDTPITFADLSAIFPDEILDTLRLLTRSPDQNYGEYIEAIAQSPQATRIKLLDLEDNINVLRLPKDLTAKDLSRTDKYHKAWRRLRMAHAQHLQGPLHCRMEFRGPMLVMQGIPQGFYPANQADRQSAMTGLTHPGSTLIEPPINPDYQGHLGDQADIIVIPELEALPI